MNNCKLALLSLAIFTSIISSGQANLDWLGGDMTISDVDHTAGYLAKVAETDANNTTVDPVDDNITTILSPSAKNGVYAIGGTRPIAAMDPGEVEPETNFSGEWSLTMIESNTRSLWLVLHQKEQIVFGRGILGSSDGSAADQSSSQASSEDRGIESMMDWLDQPPSSPKSASQAAASGTVVGDRLELDLVSIGPIALYRFDLSLSGDLVSGNYSAYGSDGSSWSGTASGSRTA
ncbi:MAG TPA: hypothetical protein PLZ42_00135 [Methanothrix sp.]|nr:hypothetical protein [Methanothrix sp.]